MKVIDIIHELLLLLVYCYMYKVFCPYLLILRNNRKKRNKYFPSKSLPLKGKSQSLHLKMIKNKKKSTCTMMTLPPDFKCANLIHNCEKIDFPISVYKIKKHLGSANFDSWAMV